MFFLIPAASTVSRKRRMSCRAVIGLPGLLPGNSQRSLQRCCRIVTRDEAWTKSGVLEEYEYRSEADRKDRKGLRVNDAQRPGTTTN
jgi:hypothetical protein